MSEKHCLWSCIFVVLISAGFCQVHCFSQYFNKKISPISAQKFCYNSCCSLGSCLLNASLRSSQLLLPSSCFCFHTSPLCSLCIIPFPTLCFYLFSHYLLMFFRFSSNGFLLSWMIPANDLLCNASPSPAAIRVFSVGSV